MEIMLLDHLLKKYPTAKRQTLKRMVEAGRVRINGKPARKLKQELAADDQVTVLDRVEEQQQSISDPTRDLEIVFEDEDILVVNKPPGLLTSTVARERRPTLLAMVRQHVAMQDSRATVGVIHRLDRDAFGLLIFSKNDAAYRSLKSQFFHHSVHREYHALVHGRPNPPAGRIENRLSERADGTVHATRQVGKGERAVSEYQVIGVEVKRSLVRVTLHTGRKHQIRVHLAVIGTPVVGDRVYGPDPQSPSLMLIATKLTIQHPRTGQSVGFTLPLPKEFQASEIRQDKNA
jgi:23S rRNA pseudouridine1911/1915/1917 synthase